MEDVAIFWRMNGEFYFIFVFILFKNLRLAVPSNGPQYQGRLPNCIVRGD